MRNEFSSIFDTMGQRFILVTSNYPPEAGGPSKFAGNFSLWATNKFETVSVIATHPDTSSEKNVKGTSVHLISRKLPILKRYLMMISTIKKLHTRDTVLLANGSFFETYLASVFFRVEYFVKLPGDIVWEHARRKGETSLNLIDFQKSKMNLKNRILRHFFSMALKKAKCVIVPSTSVFDICLGWGIKEERINVIFNGVDTDTFAPNLTIEKKFDWITVCRLTEIKRVNELIDLAHELNRKLLIVGDGHLMEVLQEQSRKLSNVATFHGLATQEELPALYNSSKFFVLNSEFEVGTPYALIEARSCGLVCIANELDGSSDVINNGVDGFLFRRNTNESLKKKLTEATNLGASYEVFSKAARRSAQEFFSERFVYSLIYEKIAK